MHIILMIQILKCSIENNLIKKGNRKISFFYILTQINEIPIELYLEKIQLQELWKAQ